ncbi:MAG TPA: glycine betaine ABC transporter substrate-binding protein [Solirubrobacteraceae bacterium]|jgi:osmoprotectant transport system substrate-binding protein|nr:glycine betaine ABC transporter substrate-binding protein [Solirubrobacteraceae bacterium]
MTKARLLALLFVIAAFVVGGCGDDDSGGGGGGGGTGTSSSSDQPGEGKPAVTIGTKDFTEEFVLGNLYAQALEAKGYKVNLKENIGATEIIDKALTSGEIDGYPEYTGVSLSVVAKNDILAESPEQTKQLVKEFYEGRGQQVSEATPFQDTDAIATTKEFAEKNNLSSVGDLKNLPSFTIGARPEFKSRFNGLKGMEKVYGIKNAKFKQLALGLQYPSLDKGDVDTANVFSTDAQLASGKYTVLEDPEGVFGFQNVYFVINKDKYDALGGQEFMDVINSVNALLTEEAMTSMNAAVDLDKKKPADVAQAFLEANGLL